MKPSIHPHQILALAAPLLAAPLICLAQNPSPVVVQTTESVVTAQPDLHATGNIRSLDSGGLTLVNDLGSMTVYLTNANTTFMNKQGQIISPTNLTQQTPITVYYTRAGNALLATRVVVSGTLFSDGTLLEVTPAELVIQLPGAPATPLHYLNTPATKFVDLTGAALPAPLAPGDLVRIFYAREGNAMVASKVEVLGPNGSGVPQAAVKTKTTTTTVTREINR